jgi:hypothetical protein
MTATPHSRNSPSPSKLVSAVETESPPDSVEQIRDILFGRQLQEFEARFNAVETMINSKNKELSVMIEKRLDNLENELNTRMDVLLKNQEKEKISRQSTQHELTKLLGDQSNEFLNKLNGVEEAANQELLDIQSLLQDQKKELYEQLGQREDNLAGIFREMSNKLTKG